MKCIECENMGIIGCPRRGEKMNGNWCGIRHMRRITWNVKRKGCADALEKQRIGEWQNMQQMAYEMHRE